jgi:CNT family concentrative nucleoside transporter
MERLIGIVGILAILGIAWALSVNRRAIRAKPILVGLALQAIFAFGVLKVPPVRAAFHWFADGAERLIRLSDHGARFLFGCLLDGEAPVEPSGGTDAGGQEPPPSRAGTARLDGVLFVKVLPPIIFFAALTSLLYYLGILQLVVQAMAFVMQRLMGVSGAEALSAAGNTVLGMTEAPLVIKPHVAHLTSSELMAVMVGGFATSAGGMLALYMSLGIPARFLLAASLMSAPAALVIAKILLPETGTPRTAGTVRTAYECTDSTAIEAIASGASVGLRLALNVAAMLIAFMAMIALVNALLGAAGSGLTLERIFGWIFAPIAFLLGVPAAEVTQVGQFLGTKISVNEFVAYSMLGKAELGERAAAIAAFALCGFANFGSIGIQIGGLGGIAPERRADVARFGLRAMLGGALASWLTAAIAGMLL